MSIYTVKSTKISILLANATYIIVLLIILQKKTEPIGYIYVCICIYLLWKLAHMKTEAGKSKSAVWTGSLETQEK